VPRALSADWRQVDSTGGDDARALLRARRDRVLGAGANFWVFASTTRPGFFLQFIEAPDAATLARARDAAGLEAAPEILSEVELT
jgi:hypothetical protein